MHMKYKKTKAETVNTSDNMTPPTGFYKQLRYKRYKTKSYVLYIFIDCNQGLSTFKNTLLTSLLMSGIGFITVLILVIIFSKIVLRPVAQSYEKQHI